MTTPSVIEHITRPQDMSQSQRLFHGRGHAFEGLEHVCVDWIAPAILITLFKEPDIEWLDQLVSGLNEMFPEQESIQVQYRCRKGAPFEVKSGRELTELVAVEDGLKYHIALGKAQNTGLFLDMLNGRRWIREQSVGKKVLNLFSYTCGFSVAAIEGGADLVVNVDMSKASLATGRDNHRLNDHALDRVVFQGVDIFKSWGRIKKPGPYDILVSDPPSFQKGSVNIQRDYHKIIRRIPELVVAGGLVMLCLNSPDLDDEFLLSQVAEHCPECSLLQKIENPDIFKDAQAGKGLKVYVFKFGE